MSSSKSQSNPNTTQLDNRRVIGENGISAENSSVSVFNQTMDPNVIAAALQFAGGGQNGAFDFGSDAFAGALGTVDRNNVGVLNFGSDALAGALTTVDRNNIGVLNFGSDALAGALGFGGSAMRAAADASSDALAFADANASRNSAMAYSIFSDALGTSEGALSKAFSFGNTALDRSFSGLADTQNIVADAYNDAKGRGALTDKILIGAIAAVALVAFAAVSKK